MKMMMMFSIIYLHKVPGNALDGFEASQHVEIKQV